MRTNNLQTNSLKLIQISVDWWDLLSDSLSLSGGDGNLVGLVSKLHWVSVHSLPMIEGALREGLSSGVGSKIGGETERLHNWKVRQQSHLRSSWSLLFGEDVSTSAGEDTVDVTHSILWNGDVTQVDWLKDSWLGSHQSSETDSSGGRHDLTHTSVDSISMKDNVHQVESASSQLLLADWSVLTGPSESTNDGLLDLNKV